MDLTTCSDEEEPDPEHIKERILNDTRQPLLLVEINLTDMREEVSEALKMETIIVFEGDKAADLADRFATQHGLSQRIQNKLTVMLKGHMARILPAINENEDE